MISWSSIYRMQLIRTPPHHALLYSSLTVAINLQIPAFSTPSFSSFDLRRFFKFSVRWLLCDVCSTLLLTFPRAVSVFSRRMSRSGTVMWSLIGATRPFILLLTTVVGVWPHPVADRFPVWATFGLTVSIFGRRYNFTRGDIFRRFSFAAMTSLCLLSTLPLLRLSLVSIFWLDSVAVDGSYYRFLSNDSNLSTRSTVVGAVTDDELKRYLFWTKRSAVSWVVQSGPLHLTRLFAPQWHVIWR